MPTTVLSVRLSDRERELLEYAADEAHTTVSDFVRRQAVEAAEMKLMDRRIVTLSPEDWERFEARMKEPPKAIPAVVKLLKVKPPWEA